MVEFVRDVIVALAVLAMVIALVVRALPEYDPPYSRHGQVPVAKPVMGTYAAAAPNRGLSPSSTN